MRKVFLENLPTINNKRIDWKSSVGMNVDFVYDDTTGIIQIAEYYGYSKLKIKYNDLYFDISSTTLRNAALSLIINYNNNNYRSYKDGVIGLKIGDVIKTKNNEITVKELNGRKIKFMCNKCLQINEMLKTNISKGRGCPVCCNQKVIKGINDIYTTDKEIAIKMLNENDMYSFTRGTNKSVDWKCDCCGRIVNKQICEVMKNKTVLCGVCNHKVSYPNRFLYCLLDMAGIKYGKEVSFKDWNISNRRYDAELIDYKILVEMDGGFGHGNKGSEKQRLDQLRVDKEKDMYAIMNGYKVIRIDCNYKYKDIDRKFNYIKDNIVSNELLSSIINFNEIDFTEIKSRLLNPLIKNVCDMWNSTDLELQEIANHFMISQSTVTEYLMLGASIGLTDFNKKNHWHRSHKNKLSQKWYVCIDTNNYFLGAKDAGKWANVSDKTICNCSRGDRKSTGKEKLRWISIDKNGNIQNGNNYYLSNETLKTIDEIKNKLIKG